MNYCNHVMYIRLLNHKWHTAHVYNQSTGYTKYGPPAYTQASYAISLGTTIQENQSAAQIAARHTISFLAWRHICHESFWYRWESSLRSLVAAESTLQQPMQPARNHPLFLCGFWTSISIVDWTKSVHQFLGVGENKFSFLNYLLNFNFNFFYLTN